MSESSWGPRTTVWESARLVQHFFFFSRFHIDCHIKPAEWKRCYRSHREYLDWAQSAVCACALVRVFDSRWDRVSDVDRLITDQIHALQIHKATPPPSSLPLSPSLWSRRWVCPRSAAAAALCWAVLGWSCSADMVSRPVRETHHHTSRRSAFDSWESTLWSTVSLFSQQVRRVLW